MRVTPPPSTSRRALLHVIAAISSAGVGRRAAFADDATTLAAASIDPLLAPPTPTSRVFLDVNIGDKPAGRIIAELWGDVTPRLADNFERLCAGQPGYGYAGSSFYRVISGLTLQAGDIGGSGGTDGRAAGGEPFAPDNYAISHTADGLLSMANSGRGGSSRLVDSRFIISLGDAKYLDGRYAAFGRVVEGMQVVRAIEALPVTGTRNAPTVRVEIAKAGVLPR